MTGDKPTFDDLTKGFTAFSSSEDDAPDGETSSQKAEPESALKPADKPAESDAEDTAAPEDTADGSDSEEASSGNAAVDDDDDDDDGEDQSKRKRSVTQRINKAVARQREAERRVRELEQQLAAQRNASQDLTRQQEKGTEPDDDSPPDPSDSRRFPYGEIDPAFIQALVDYQSKRNLREFERRQQEIRQKEIAEEAARRAQKRATEIVERGIRKYADFKESVVDTAQRGDWPLSQTILNLALNSEVGEDVLYYLATNADNAQEIAAKPDIEQALYFGRLEARFLLSRKDTKSPKSKPNVSKAPQPVRQARGSISKVETDDESGSFADFEAKYMRRFRSQQ